jgi:hypothetical protein
MRQLPAGYVKALRFVWHEAPSNIPFGKDQVPTVKAKRIDVQVLIDGFFEPAR